MDLKENKNEARDLTGKNTDNQTHENAGEQEKSEDKNRGCKNNCVTVHYQ